MRPEIRKLLIILAAILVPIGVAYFAYQQYINNTRGTIVVESVPTDLTLTLSGKRIAANGKQTITPGKYTLEGKRAGFETTKQEITVKAKQSQNVFMYMAANGAEGDQWLRDHPDEAIKLETIGGREHKEAVEEAIDQNEFIRQLPYLGPGLAWRIDYGGAAPDNKFPEQPTIYISARDEEARADALQWMRTNGWDPDGMNIVFKPKD